MVANLHPLAMAVLGAPAAERKVLESWVAGPSLPSLRALVALSPGLVRQRQEFFVAEELQTNALALCYQKCRSCCSNFEIAFQLVAVLVEGPAMASQVASHSRAIHGQPTRLLTMMQMFPIVYALLKLLFSRLEAERLPTMVRAQSCSPEAVVARH